VGSVSSYYTASVDELTTQPLARYVSELIRIRKQYADLLFFGRFNDAMARPSQETQISATPFLNRCSR